MLMEITAFLILINVIAYFICYVFGEKFGFKNKDHVSYTFGLIFLVLMVLLYIS